MIVRMSAAVTAYPVMIDYRRSLDEMVKAGRYDYANPNVTAKHFPVQGNGKVLAELVLFHFNRDIGSDHAIIELDKHGVVPAKIEYLLAFGAKYPELQKQFPIICLGSVWTFLFGFRRVPCLGIGVYFRRRRLSLFCWSGGWPRSCRFAAVRKVSTAL
jgi:hypothetical protein